MDESTEELKANMEKAFAERVEADQKLTALADHLNSGKGTYVTAEQYSYETGKVLSGVFREQITEEKLPEGVFTREFVQETIEPLLKDDHKIVSTMAAVAQENINTAAGVHIQPQKADFNQDRADGFATKMDGKTMEEAGWMLGSPVTNFSQSVVDETMIKNGEVLAKAGKAATIKRQAEAKCCDWCLNKAGTYDATNREAYQRHRECRCEIEMHIDGSVKRQIDWKHNQWKEVKARIDKKVEIANEDRRMRANPVEISRQNATEILKNDSNGDTINNKETLLIRKCINNNVEYVEVRKLESNQGKTTEEIVKRIAKYDTTAGSCQSVAFAYVGNKAGYDVHDFRGGNSYEVFSRNSVLGDITLFPGVKYRTIKASNDIQAAKQLLRSMQSGKEYILASGGHTAIVRRIDKRYEYLEMQAKIGNGYRPLTDDVLSRRFKCRKSHTVYGVKMEYSNTLIDVESLLECEEFINILGYINTKNEE